MKLWIEQVYISYCLSREQQRCWSDCADAHIFAWPGPIAQSPLITVHLRRTWLLSSFEPEHSRIYQMKCVPSRDSTQPAHWHILASHSFGSQGVKAPSYTDWLDCTDSRLISVVWVSSRSWFCRFCHSLDFICAASWQKPTKWHERAAKTQIGLGIRSVWSESSLCAQWVAKDLSFLHADSQDWSDWADAKADLSLRWAHRSFCLFYHEAVHMRCPFTVWWKSTSFCIYYKLVLVKTINKCLNQTMVWKYL